MIRVSRLDRHEIAINCDLIESIEEKPDTTIRLVNGQSLVVREELEEILRRIAEYRSRVLARAGWAALLSGAARAGGPQPADPALALTVETPAEGEEPR